MIVFGWNSFILTRIKPSSVDLPAEMDAVNTFEKRQKYFHLFWIPFFPIGQDWVIKKKKDSNAYEPNAELKQYLESLPMKHKTPWYTYALPLLVVAGGIIAFLYMQVSSYQNKIQNEEYVKQQNEKFQLLVNNGASDAYITLRTKEYTDAYLKVLSSDATTLTCLVSLNEKYRNYENRLLEAFMPDSANNGFDTVRVLKSDLIHMHQNRDVYPFEGKKIGPEYDTMKVVEFQVIDYPVFDFAGAKYVDGNYLSVFTNIGTTVYDFKFKPSDHSTGTLQLDTTAFPTTLPHGSRLILSGQYSGAEPEVSGIVFVKNHKNGKDSCRLSINGVNAYLSKIK